MGLQYLHYDVFTDTPLTGNQLAVFFGAQDVPAARMQAIAREMNFSESTFVLPPETPETRARVRIFTPAVEMPMAGHPTIGTTFALADRGDIPAQTPRVVLGLNIGPTPVDLEWEGSQLSFAWMTQRPPEFGTPVGDRVAAARAIGLTTADLIDHLPVQRVSCGVAFLIVPVADPETVDRAVADLEVIAALTAREQAHAVFLFAPEAPGAGRVYSRMFASGLGIREDPATGSASGPLGCYLVQHGLVPSALAGQIVSRQGVKMGRPSRIHIAIGGVPGAITSVRVGGRAVLVARGELAV